MARSIPRAGGSLDAMRTRPAPCRTDVVVWGLALASAMGCAQGRGMSDAAGGPRDAAALDAAIAFPAAAPPDAPGLDAPFAEDAFAAAIDASALDAASPRDAGSDTWSPDAGRCTGMMCGGRCVDTTRDPMHCGGCDRPCALPFATATCVASRCTVGSCEAGRGDCNTRADDGCEASCASGSSCTTSCGSSGSLLCTSVCAPSCTPPSESCNARDDDCDGGCDEELAACRESVVRAYHDTLGGHFYTRDRSEIGAGGFRTESDPFFFVYPSAQPGLAPFHRCYLGRAHRLYTLDAGCEGSGATYEGILGYVATSAICGARPLYRLSARDDHFYTVDPAERDYAISIGYVDEGIAVYVW